MSQGTKIALISLFILVLVSLVLNGILLWQWWTFRQQTQQTIQQLRPLLQTSLAQASADLESFAQSTIEFELPVQQEFPVQVEIPFRESLEVPIQTTVPISQEIRTTITVTPLPGVNIPTEVTVPVNLDIPIDLTIPVAIDRTIPISTSVPLDIRVPIAIKVSETGLAVYLERLRAGLDSLEQALSAIE